MEQNEQYGIDLNRTKYIKKEQNVIIWNRIEQGRMEQSGTEQDKVK